MSTPDQALMEVLSQGLINWLSPACSDMFSKAEREADRARWEARAMGPQVIEVEALILRENATGVQVENGGGSRVWLNKDEIEIDRDPERTNQVRIRLPAKLAKTKGLS